MTKKQHSNQGTPDVLLFPTEVLSHLGLGFYMNCNGQPLGSSGLLRLYSLYLNSYSLTIPLGLLHVIPVASILSFLLPLGLHGPSGDCVTAIYCSGHMVCMNLFKFFFRFDDELPREGHFVIITPTFSKLLIHNQQ